jgi:ubiquinone/menaquinone biosynthesis C-methylase UbiE
VTVTADTLSAYQKWAPTYPPVAHNPLMRAEQAAMTRYWPPVAGLRVLDLACGSGRYSRLLAAEQPAEIVSLDFCLPMLHQVSGTTRVCASMMQLPFGAGSFDAVISGLAIGHATDVFEWMHEVARVLRPGGTLLYSDFHPAAAQAGLTRSFKDQDDQTQTVPHRYFDVAAQQDAARRARLTVDVVHEVKVGAELREAFANSAQFYARWDGLPIVLVMRARK